MFGSQENMDKEYDNTFEKLEQMKKTVNKVKMQMQNPVRSLAIFAYISKEFTTFVAVCIAEFLSMYETERLLEELMNQNIDIKNIVIN